MCSSDLQFIRPDSEATHPQVSADAADDFRRQDAPPPLACGGPRQDHQPPSPEVAVAEQHHPLAEVLTVAVSVPHPQRLPQFLHCPLPDELPASRQHVANDLRLPVTTLIRRNPVQTAPQSAGPLEIRLLLLQEPPPKSSLHDQHQPVATSLSADASSQTNHPPPPDPLRIQPPV